MNSYTKTGIFEVSHPANFVVRQVGLVSPGCASAGGFVLFEFILQLFYDLGVFEVEIFCFTGVFVQVV